jgi:transposase
MWCVPDIDQEFVVRMEDVLELYARRFKESPVVCLDERPVQLLDPARPSVPMKPGRVRRADYEYVREGTANIFCIVEPKAGRWLTYASANRKAKAFARALFRIARRYSKAKKIHLVVDNLNTHKKKSLTDALGSDAGSKLWRRFKIHYTPKHASWLNAAEMEASLVSRECLGRRRIGHLHTLKSQVAAWRLRIDRERRPIRWKFTVKDARRVLRYDGIVTPRSEH